MLGHADHALVQQRVTVVHQDSRVGPGPRRGHTAARAFQISPAQLASHAIICFCRSEAAVDQLTEPIAMLAIR
jgi:hypothetical protein